MGNGHADDYFRLLEWLRLPSDVPTVYKDGADGIDWYSTKIPNITYTLEDSDAFYKAISDVYEIEESWIPFGDVDKQQDIWIWNYPVAGDAKVFTPKDVTRESYNGLNDLLNRLKIMRSVGNHDDSHFIIGIPFFIPFVGYAARAVVEDPKNDFMASFSTLAGAGVERAAYLRRDMLADDIKNLGLVKAKLDLIQGVRVRVCKI
ncbi:hypothetical protein V8C40DRAFT_268832 [Trichoderma camerunense]